MMVEDLRPGRDGSIAEIGYIRDIVSLVIESGYKGQFEVVGPREREELVNRMVFEETCQDLPKEERDKWYDFVNRRVRDLGISFADIPGLKELLPADAPKAVRGFFDSNKDLGTELILVTDKLPRAMVDREWEDEGSGLRMRMIENIPVEQRVPIGNPPVQTKSPEIADDGVLRFRKLVKSIT